jgi:hypothetical protein
LDNYTELRPNYFLHWKAIEKFHGESYRYYDFGGTDPTNEGLLFFKRNWGCEETERLFYSCPAEAESADDHRSSLLVSPSRFIYATLKKSLPDFARSGLCERLSKYTID